MIKNSRVEVAKTPSELSGRISVKIVNGDALAAGEEQPEKNLEKAAAVLQDSSND